jgi:signal peptidase I
VLGNVLKYPWRGEEGQVDQTKRRVPIISFLLSILWPGLGHVYNGRLGEGILFFLGLCLLLFLLASTGLIFSLAGLITLLAVGIVGRILIATLAAIEADRLKEAHLKWYNRWYIYVCAVLLVNLLSYVAIPFARHHFLGVKAFKVPASNMRPALQEGDHFIAKLEKYGDRLPQRGDIVVFPYPEDRSVDFIKRVIGLPGERIEIKHKVVFINDKRLEDPWGVHFGTTTIAAPDNCGPIDIPEGSVFVLGDNRDNSLDSRFWGNVQIKDIEGKAVIIYWSNDLKRIGKQLN